MKNRQSVPNFSKTAGFSKIPEGEVGYEAGVAYGFCGA